MTAADHLTERVQRQTGERYTAELVAIKKRQGVVTAEDARTAAWLATLNRRERRRLGLR